MATQIQLTRSGSPGEQPTATEMELGELALNYADGKLFFKNSSNNIEQLNSTYNNSGQKIFVNESDNHIGLNTVSPAFLLDLGGSSAHHENSLRLNQNDGGTAIRIGGSAAGDITLLRVDNANGETAGEAETLSFPSSAEGFRIRYLGSNNHELAIFADNGGTEFQALTFLQDGKIGIGTGTPSKRLDVNGSAIIQANFDVNGDLTIGGNTVLGNATSDTTSISGGLTVDTDTLVVDESNNRVGINNSGPSAALDVTGNIVSDATITGTTISGTTLTDGTTSINGGTITGVTDITASGNVIAATPTADTHLATKAYVDAYRSGEVIEKFFELVPYNELDTDSQSKTITLHGGSNFSLNTIPKTVVDAAGIELTTTYQDIDASKVNYMCPVGAKTITYRFVSFHGRGSLNPLIHVRLRLGPSTPGGSTALADTQVSMGFKTHYHEGSGEMKYEFPFEIVQTAEEEDRNRGKIFKDNWEGISREIYLEAREYKGANSSVLFRIDHEDGVQVDKFSTPSVGIETIAR